MSVSNGFCEYIFGKTMADELKKQGVDVQVSQEIFDKIEEIKCVDDKKIALKQLLAGVYKKYFMNIKFRNLLILNKELIIESFLESEEYECLSFFKKVETINNLIDKIPAHVFKGVDKTKFTEFIENVFIKIETLELFNTSAAVSFLKLKFKTGNIDINSAVVMIKNQCKK